jgi:hypothetical protein
MKRLEELWEKADFAVLQLVGASVIVGSGCVLLFPLVEGLAL